LHSVQGPGLVQPDDHRLRRLERSEDAVGRLERGAVGLVAQGLDREAGAVVEHGHVLVSLGALLLRRHEPVVLVVATGGEAEENGDGGEVHDEEEVLVEAGTGTAHAAAPHCSVRGYTGAGTNTRRSSRRVVPAPRSEERRVGNGWR